MTRVRVVVLALDPGGTTGWAIVRHDDRALLGMGNFDPDELGCGLDLLVRSMHRLGYEIHPVVEQMPRVGGVGSLALELEFVRRTIDHWLDEIFELNVRYVQPGTWKPSRAAKINPAPKEWNGKQSSQHMRDAYQLAIYEVGKSGSPD